MYRDPIVVGADLSLTDTGLFSIDLETREINFASIKTKPKDFNYPNERKRYIADSIKDFLDKVTNNGELCYKVVYEGYAFNKFGGESSNLTDLAELKGVVMDIIGDGITVTTQQVKKIATDHGKITQALLKKLTGTLYKGTYALGKAKKQLVIDGVKKRFNFETKNDNIADACSLAHIGVSIYGDKDMLGSYGIGSKAQLEVVKAVRKKFKQEIS